VHGFVQGRQRLGAQERRRKELMLGPNLDPFTRDSEDDAAVDDESRHAASTLAHPPITHPPASERRAAGATFENVTVFYLMSVALVGAETPTRWFQLLKMTLMRFPPVRVTSATGSRSRAART
jgi:hypothetical protein